jgi:tetratricopeptide (TPR) repeat protein
MVIEGGHGRVYDHTISIPSMVNTRELGLPNACSDCHALEDPGWEYDWFERWYPGAEARNRRTALARAIEGGRSGRPGAKKGLLALLGDENPVYRAGATRLLSKYRSTDLRPQLEDPHVMVRRAAIVGVARTHPDELLPILDNENPVLRYVALMELLQQGAWLRSRPAQWEKLLKRLEHFTALRPDLAENHFALANLRLLAGRTREAIESYERYLRVNPWDRSTRQRLAALQSR